MNNTPQSSSEQTSTLGLNDIVGLQNDINNEKIFLLAGRLGGGRIIIIEDEECYMISTEEQGYSKSKLDPEKIPQLEGGMFEIPQGEEDNCFFLVGSGAFSELDIKHHLDSFFVKNGEGGIAKFPDRVVEVLSNDEQDGK